MKTIELTVEGMTCGSCVKHVKQALQSFWIHGNLILLSFIDQRKKVFHCAGLCKSIIDLVIKELPS